MYFEKTIVNQALVTASGSLILQASAEEGESCPPRLSPGELPGLDSFVVQLQLL